MGKLRYIVLILVLVTGLSVSASALGTPDVVANHGNINAMVIEDGISFGGELGLKDNIGIYGYFGNSYDRLGLKYEIKPNLAAVGGFMDSSAFVGINAAQGLTDELLGMAELDLTSADGKIKLFYDLGVKYGLTDGMDVRAGVIGKTGHSSLQIGFGYNF